jgi:hypothetical protein
VKWNGTSGWMSSTYLEAKDGAGVGVGCEAATTGADTPTTDQLEVSANGRAQMTRIVSYADAHDSGSSDGRCFQYVWGYLYQSGYGTIDSYYDAPNMSSAEARNFAEYFNVKSNADSYGLQRLPLTNPYDAPVGAVVVVAAGSPGTRHPTAGDISIAAGGGRFINDGPNMGYGGSASYFATHGGRVLGIFVPK